MPIHANYLRKRRITTEKKCTDFDGQTRYMKTMGEQDTFTQHSLVSSRKLDFRNGECVPQMQTSVHIWVWEVAKPLWVLLFDFRRRQTSDVLSWRSIDLE